MLPHNQEVRHKLCDVSEGIGRIGILDYDQVVNVTGPGRPCTLSLVTLFPPCTCLSESRTRFPCLTYLQNVRVLGAASFVWKSQGRPNQERERGRGSRRTSGGIMQRERVGVRLKVPKQACPTIVHMRQLHIFCLIKSLKPVTDTWDVYCRRETAIPPTK